MDGLQEWLPHCSPQRQPLVLGQNSQALGNSNTYAWLFIPQEVETNIYQGVFMTSSAGAS